MNSASRLEETAVKMTAKDWETLEQVTALEQELLRMREAKLTPTERKDAKVRTARYGEIVSDPKAARIIEKCFGDPAVLEHMRAFHDELSRQLAA